MPQDAHPSMTGSTECKPTVPFRHLKRDFDTPFRRMTRPKSRSEGAWRWSCGRLRGTQALNVVEISMDYPMYGECLTTHETP
jgi:hypothetical protein